ncbi:MAG TPA: hypothetical protein VFP19_05565, partial [Candidatus Limnocylindrales bacterium]|nr:hypothetical protein [Candidatus Limnocylindrales bacterium]
SRAQEQAAFLISERGLTEGATEEGRQIVAAAEAAGREVAEGADSYATQVLLALQTEVEKTLAAIHKGIDVLDDRRAQLRGSDAPSNGNGAAHLEDVFAVEAMAGEVGSGSSPAR